MFFDILRRLDLSQVILLIGNFAYTGTRRIAL
jgi:hypothetical protein